MGDDGMLPRGYGESRLARQTTAEWMRPEEIEREARTPGSAFHYRSGALWLGRTEAGTPVGWTDNRHRVTIAGSRAGKGRDAIIPMLCEYPGSVIVVDPKGENAFRTAARRGEGGPGITGKLGQKVYVLDPFGISRVPNGYRATFDPLALITPSNPEAVEDAGLIADALVLAGNKSDPHWDESARNFISALILHVASWHSCEGRRDMKQVYTFLFEGDQEEHARQAAPYLDLDSDDPVRPSPSANETAFRTLLHMMGSNPAFDGAVSAVGRAFLDIGERELGSILSTARRNLQFISSPGMKEVLSGSSGKCLDLDDLKADPNGISVYIVLPARRISTHSRWIRLVLNLVISRMEVVSSAYRPKHPVLAVCDEFPILGHMSALESAVGYMAGYDLLVWAILQDLGQLKRHYPEGWESFIANAGLVQCFGVTDQTTLDYVSKRLGEIEVIGETLSRSEGKSLTISDLSDYARLKETMERNLFSRFFDKIAMDGSTEAKSESENKSNSYNEHIIKATLLTSEEVSRYFSRESMSQIVMVAGRRPIALKRTPYHEDRYFHGKWQGE